MIALISKLSSYSSLLPLVLFLAFSFRKSTVALKVIFFYCIFSLGTDFTASIFPKNSVSSRDLKYFLTIIEYSFVVSFLYLIARNNFFRKFVLGVSVLFLIYWSLYFIQNFIKSKNTSFDSIPASVESILITIFCILYLFEQISKPQEYFLYSSPNFWIVLAFFIYMSGTFFLFIVSTSISVNEKDQYWVINNICNIITNILVSIAFVINGINNKKPPAKRPDYEIFENYK